MGLFSRLAKTVGRVAQRVVDVVNDIVGAEPAPPAPKVGPLPTVIDEEVAQKARPKEPTLAELAEVVRARVDADDEKERRATARRKLADELGPINPIDERTGTQVERDSWVAYFEHESEHVPQSWIDFLREAEDMSREYFTVSHGVIIYIGADGVAITKEITRVRRESLTSLCRGLKYHLEGHRGDWNDITLSDATPNALDQRTRRLEKKAAKEAAATTRPVARKSGRKVSRPRLPGETPEEKKRRLARERSARYYAKKKAPKKET